MSTSLFNLTGRVALVTGASRGLGKTFALALARSGADVAVSHDDAVEAVKEATGGRGADVVVDDVGEATWTPARPLRTRS